MNFIDQFFTDIHEFTNDELKSMYKAIEKELNLKTVLNYARDHKSYRPRNKKSTAAYITISKRCELIDVAGKKFVIDRK